MAKQLNVNLAFTADTGKAKAQLQDLQNTLTNLINSQSFNGKNGFSDELFQASKAAAELKVHLQSATNAKTGNLDFTKLNDSISKSGKSLIEYGENLVKLGPQGQQAFMKLTQSVANAEVPIRRSNALLTEMWTTLKNTARWQISSSILHGFMGAVQSAYGYAQDLNESLNNIRIVTGQNIEQMAQFADQAQRAAKSLSTTTTAYTNAALIYYQQGDSDDTVLQKTDITTKMANVTGQSAEVVSDQLTAIWNNFNKTGEESYEKYADILTALGAATASSTDEIAGGLEKFASIADMIGLSYEYAATSLATITATTRQSEEVVGTALKTIFARIQGLNLGETLDDGTNLNKYSEALQKVGISIFDQAGELKQMDAILDELGDKWGTISKDQQVALAQTVAGVRQYNQLVSLMDNWDYFEENLALAENSEGALQEQADIYAESWAAASNRVRAALEGIYSSLVDDESFIDILNIIEKVITYFDNLIDTVGGLSGVVTTLGAILTRVFSKQLAQSISNIAHNIKMATPSGRQQVIDKKTEFIEGSASIMAGMAGEADTQANETASTFYKEKLTLQQKMIENSERMSEEERQTLQLQMDQLDVLGKQNIEKAKQADQVKNKKADAATNIYTAASSKAIKENKKFDLKGTQKQLSDIKTTATSMNEVSKMLSKVSKEAGISQTEIDELHQKLKQLKNAADQGGLNQQDLFDFDTADAELTDLIQGLKNATGSTEEWEASVRQVVALFGGINEAAITSTAESTGADIEQVRNYSDAVVEEINVTEQLDQQKKGLTETTKKLGEEIDNAQGKQKTWADNLVTFANSALSVVSALQMIGGIVDTIQDPEMTGWEKFLSIGSSLLMMATMLIPAFTSLQGMLVGTGASAAGATGPVIGFGAALNAALGPIGWVALALTALVAIFAVVMANLDTASEKAQKKFNQMAEDAEHASESLADAESSYESLQETISSYSDARDNIDSLTQGTEEFKQAVNEANAAARELIETYGVAGTFNSETGLIEIDEDALKEAEEKALQDLEDARINNAAAQTNKLMASSDLANAKAAEKNNAGFWELAGGGALVGGTLGTMTGNPVIAAIGALAGFATGAYGYASQTGQDEKQMAALESLQDSYIEAGGNLESAMSTLTDSEKSLIDSLGLTDSELANLCSEVSANTAAILQNNKQIIDENFEDNAAYKNSKYKDELNTVLASELEDKTEDIYNSKWKDKGKLGGGITDKEAQQAYAEMMGYTWVKDMGSNLGKYSKGDGSEDFTVSDETARRALAQKEALEALGQSVEDYNASLERVNQTGESFGEGVGDLMLRMAGGNGASFADAARNEIEAMEQALADADVATDIISDEDAQNLGYDNAEDYVEALELGIASYNDGLANVGADLSDKFSHGFLEGVEDLTLAGAESMASNLTNAFKISGSEAANALDEIFIDAGEDADELSALLEGVNWGDPNAVDKLNAAIEEQGLDVDTTSEEWEKYTSIMAAAGMAIGGVHSKFDSLRSIMADTNSVVEDLEIGGIISDEDYEKLAEINPLIKDMFMVTAEGYKFTGDKSVLENILVGNTKESIASVKEEFENLSKEGSALTNVNWFDEEGNKEFSSDRHVAMIADYASDDSGINLDNALAYMGVSKESLQEASAYILQYTDEQGNILTDAAGFDQAKYDEYVAQTQNVYNQLADIRQAYLDGDFSQEQAEQLIASTATNMAELQTLYAEGSIGLDTYQQALTPLATNALNAATSLQELQAAMDLANQLGAEVDHGTYAENLIRLAEEYDNCTQEVLEYQAALASGKGVDAAEEALEASMMLAESAEKYGFEAKELEVQAKQLAKAYGLDAEAAAKLAVQNQRMNKGMITLAENWTDWKKALKSTDKTTLDYADAVVNCTEAIADLVGASEDLELPEEFFNDENLALMEAAMNGDTEAVNKLGAAVAICQVEMLTFNEALAALAEETNGIEVGSILNEEQFTTDKATVLAGLEEIKNGALTAGGEMDAEWVAALNRMALATGMSVEQMNGLLGSMGVQAKVETTYVKQPMEVPTYEEHWESTTHDPGEKDENGEWIRPPSYSRKKYTVPGAPYTVEGYAAVAQISTEDNPLTVDVHENTVGASGPSSSGATYSGNRGSVAPSTTDAVNDAKSGSGGSSKPATETEVTKKSDVVDRYKELDDALDDVADAFEDAAKEADRLYGKARIDKIKQQNNLIQQEIGLLKDKVAAAKQYLDIDRAALDAAAVEAGVSFVYDEAGNLTNYTQQMEQLYNELRAAQDAWNADYQNKTDEEQQEYEENIIQPIQDKIDELKEAIAAYEETRELIEDLENEIDDKFYEWQDNNYEILHYELEIEIEINDLELEYIDYYLNKITDDFYAMAEAAQYMNNQIPIMTDSLGRYENFYNEITAAYAAGEISQAAYVEGMQESYSAILDQLSALNDLDKEMMHYYEETLDAASEELSYYTDQMEHLTGVLEHYRNIVELVNGEFDYEAIGTILEGQATTLKNELDVASANYQMLLSEQAAAEEAYRNAQDEAAKELYWEELQAITTRVDEAHDQMLSKTEEWAEAQKAIMENAMAEAAHEMEMAFSNGMGFDALNNSLDRLNSYADEYLTKTNQIYETQTLINTAQKAIDKTTNEAAKARLKAYTEEIQQLQEKNKLSNLELDIAKAKYDVLLAEIALEEAQNAKSTVRLQRDSEGNFGYVYTADQEAISTAEQDLMDAQNALYNIGLEGTNEYGQKILELQQQLADQLIALEEARAAGQFATEAEYYAARDQLIAEYTDLFTAYSEQYTTALGVDTAIQEEAWINAYDNMINKSLDWKDHTEEYTEKCEDAYKSWRDVVESESEVIDGVLNDLEQEVKDVTDESTELKNEVVNKIIPALKNQLVSVRNVTSAYAAQRSAIQQLISYYEQLAQSILKAIQAQAGLSDAMGTGTSSSSRYYDPNTDYSAVMAGYLAAGGTVGSDTWNELEAQREAKIDGENYEKDYYGSRVGESDYNPQASNKWYEDKDAVNDKLEELGIPTFATGGYTGLWGPEGRLAMLHEKELVLNPDDTVNFLSATQMLRDIVDLIDINSLRNQISFLPSLGIGSGITSGELTQQVQIEAHFPSVTDRNEIEEAFNNLVNTASQYANRR